MTAEELPRKSETPVRLTARERAYAKRALRRARRRAEKALLEDTPKRLTRGWAD